MIEFAYNSSYIWASRWRILSHCVVEVIDHLVLIRGWWEPTNWFKETLKSVQLIHERLRTTQSRHKSYTDRQRWDLKFEVGNHFFLKMSETKGVMRLSRHEKLSLKYISSLEILDLIRSIAYRQALPPHLSGVHKSTMFSCSANTN